MTDASSSSAPVTAGPRNPSRRTTLAACAGVIIPMLRERLGADPAIGGSVMITALTDSGGFFIFLGLATLFLL